MAEEGKLTVGDFLPESRKLRSEDFVEFMDGVPVLVLHKSILDEDSNAKAFRTQTVEKMQKEALLKLTQSDVFLVRKANTSSFATRISIGRSSSNDVRIPYPRVSKFHAYIDLTNTDDAFKLCDAGSTNGTSIDGVMLEPKKPAALRSGCRVGLGPYSFFFLHCEAFYAFLRRQDPRKTPDNP